jgi:hypothetical protein
MEDEEVSRIIQNDSEEKALLLFSTYHKKTSVLYDMQSLTCLLKKDDIEEYTKEILAHLMLITLK